MNYGNNTVTAAQRRTLTDAETARAEQALGQARMMVNSSAGILGAATGKSSDHPGEAAVILYVDGNASAPATVDGMRTVVISTTARALAYGSAPRTAFESNAVQALSGAVLSQAVTAKQQIARKLMRRNAAFFGVGVGQSLDNPKEAALVIYVDRRKLPAQLPATVDGLRTRYVIMDRLHVTRSYVAPVRSEHHCMAHPASRQTESFDFRNLFRPRSLKLF
jgi:hypothetical protein